MGRARAWIAVVVSIAFATGCGAPQILHAPLYSVVAREDSACAKACVEQTVESEQQTADCLSRCEGARKVEEQGCIEASRAGHACATAWREHTNDHNTAKSVAWGVGVGAVAVGLVMLVFYAMLSPLGGAHPS